MSDEAMIRTVGELKEYIEKALADGSLALTDKLSAPDLYGSSAGKGPCKVQIFEAEMEEPRNLSIWGPFA
jgi:hypothetical protein